MRDFTLVFNKVKSLFGDKFRVSQVLKLNYIARKSVLMRIALILHNGAKFASLVTREAVRR